MKSGESRKGTSLWSRGTGNGEHRARGELLLLRMNMVSGLSGNSHSTAKPTFTAPCPPFPDL